MPKKTGKPKKIVASYSSSKDRDKKKSKSKMDRE